MISVYLDVCCLNRPFDDQTQDRVRLETAAVETVVYRVKIGSYIGVGSEAVRLETERISDPECKARVQAQANIFTQMVTIQQEQVVRGRLLENLGFKTLDALHVACAEHGQANILLTTDDRFMRLANRVHKELFVKVANPVNWLSEVDRNGN